MLADERGMGRYVRPLLRGLAARPQVALTLLVRDPRSAAAYRELVGASVEVTALSAARDPDRFDRVWFPWNGMRFGARAPAVVTMNDDFAFAYPARGYIARRREQGPIRTAVRRAARIVTISAWARRRLSARFGLDPRRVAILPLGADPYFAPGDETSPFDQPFVLAVGAAEGRKNIPFLISACSGAFAAGNIRLVLIGRPDAAVKRSLSAAHIPVTLLPSVADEALRRLYRTAAAVAVPSLAEGYGLVAAEALACGAAVIAAAASALPEVVGNAGILADPADRRAWERGLRALVEDQECAATYRRRAVHRPAIAPEQTLEALVTAFESTFDDRP